jgi:hypothetical protein
LVWIKNFTFKKITLERLKGSNDNLCRLKNYEETVADLSTDLDEAETEGKSRIIDTTDLEEKQRHPVS